MWASRGWRFTLAACLMLMLWWLPLVNGLICGALAAWPETDRRKGLSAAIWTALALAPLLWMMTVFGVSWRPFADWNGELRVAVSVGALVVSAVAVMAARTTHPAI